MTNTTTNEITVLGRSNFGHDLVLVSDLSRKLTDAEVQEHFGDEKYPRYYTVVRLPGARADGEDIYVADSGTFYARPSERSKFRGAHSIKALNEEIEKIKRTRRRAAQRNIEPIPVKLWIVIDKESAKRGRQPLKEARVERITHVTYHGSADGERRHSQPRVFLRATMEDGSTKDIETGQRLYVNRANAQAYADAFSFAQAAIEEARGIRENGSAILVAPEKRGYRSLDLDEAILGAAEAHEALAKMIGSGGDATLAVRGQVRNREHRNVFGIDTVPSLSE